MIKETWKQIQGYPRYQISSYGRVKSFTSRLYPQGKLVKISTDKNGYKHVNLTDGTERCSSNNTKTMTIHRLVALHFIPIPEELQKYDIRELQVDHILPVSLGGDIVNPDTGEFNLRWVTPYENSMNPYTIIHRINMTEKVKKKVYQYDENLTLINTYESTAAAARALNASQGNIAQCVNGYLPRYYGFIFSYQPLTDISQRDALEKEQEQMRLRTRRNVLNAIAKYQKKAQLEGRAWYQRNAEKSRAISKEYYWSHREEILRKAKEKKAKEREQKQNRG